MASDSGGPFTKRKDTCLQFDRKPLSVVYLPSLSCLIATSCNGTLQVLDIHSGCNLRAIHFEQEGKSISLSFSYPCRYALFLFRSHCKYPRCGKLEIFIFVERCLDWASWSFLFKSPWSLTRLMSCRIGEYVIFRRNFEYVGALTQVCSWYLVCALYVQRA